MLRDGTLVFREPVVLARIATLLADVALACAASDLPKASGDTDTAAFEIVLLERAFGALLPVVL